MGRLDRLFRQSLRDLNAALNPLGLVAQPRVKKTVTDPDRLSMSLRSLEPPIRYDVVRHYQGVAIETWINDKRLCSMDAGEEVELVMYSLLMHQKILAEKRLAALKQTTAYFKEVQDTNPEAWERFRNIGKKEPGGEKKEKPDDAGAPAG